jgi:hypothetical protein
MNLAPQIEGAVTIRSSAASFRQAFRNRVAAGVLMGHPHPRSNYRVAGSGPDHLRIQAADWWTAINVGLNDVELEFLEPSSVKYRVRYWRWAGYVITLCGVLGLIGIFLLAAFDVRAYIARTPYAALPGLSTEENLLIAWAMAVFWGFAWPWVLIAFHKGPLHRLVGHLIAEVDAQAPLTRSGV